MLLVCRVFDYALDVDTQVWRLGSVAEITDTAERFPHRRTHSTPFYSADVDEDRHADLAGGEPRVVGSGRAESELDRIRCFASLAHQQPDAGEQPVALTGIEESGQAARVGQGDDLAERFGFGDGVVEPGVPAALDEVQAQLGRQRCGGGGHLR